MLKAGAPSASAGFRGMETLAAKAGLQGALARAAAKAQADEGCVGGPSAAEPAEAAGPSACDAVSAFGDLGEGVGGGEGAHCRLQQEDEEHLARDGGSAPSAADGADGAGAGLLSHDGEAGGRGATLVSQFEVEGMHEERLDGSEQYDGGDGGGGDGGGGGGDAPTAADVR